MSSSRRCLSLHKGSVASSVPRSCHPTYMSSDSSKSGEHLRWMFVSQHSLDVLQITPSNCAWSHHLLYYSKFAFHLLIAPIGWTGILLRTLYYPKRKYLQPVHARFPILDKGADNAKKDTLQRDIISRRLLYIFRRFSSFKNHSETALSISALSSLSTHNRSKVFRQSSSWQSSSQAALARLTAALLVSQKMRKSHS